MEQLTLNLQSAILDAYRENGGKINNRVLYKKVAERLGLQNESENRAPVGKSGAMHNLFNRKVRWIQQNLKAMGVLRPSERGVWEYLEPVSDKLSAVKAGFTLLGFSTRLGVALLGSCESALANLDAPISLILTSPPYPLARARDYGNPKLAEYIDWFCKTIEPVIKNLRDGGTIALNLSGDIFEKGSPARSTYIERLIIALEDRMGLKMLDRIIWHNPSRPPGPVEYASIRRVHLNATYEFVIWMTNNPKAITSDNRRVLQEHSEKHQRFIANGGVLRADSHSDGAHRKRVGSYSNQTAGKIPRNVLQISHTCASQKQYKADVREHGLPAHGAPMPLRLARFLIDFMTKPDDLVVDPFAGSFTTGKAAEDAGRRWICCEKIVQYVQGGSHRFSTSEGYFPSLFGCAAKVVG
jgi:DNA modification methylase